MNKTLHSLVRASMCSPLKPWQTEEPDRMCPGYWMDVGGVVAIVRNTDSSHVYRLMDWEATDAFNATLKAVQERRDAEDHD